jgi:hypothetical protein
MNDYKFNGFSANVEVDILEQFKKSITNEKSLNELNNIVLKVDFFGKDSINFITNFIENTNKIQYNKELSKIINGIGESVKGSLSTWAAFTFTPIFEPAKYNYRIAKEGKITKINYHTKESDCIEYLTNSESVDSFQVNYNSSVIKMYPVFEITPLNKRILKSNLTSFNGFTDVKIKIKYKDFDKIKIPENVSMSVKNSNMNATMNIKFNNIVLK